MRVDASQRARASAPHEQELTGLTETRQYGDSSLTRCEPEFVIGSRADDFHHDEIQANALG